jgi:hypothetical protein
MSNGRFNITGQTLGGVADPENSDDAVTKNFHDTALSGKAALSHSHSQSDITGLVSDLAAKAVQADVTAALAGKANVSHTHGQSDITNLVSDLASKAASSHTHLQSDVTNLVSDLAGKSPTSHTHTGLVTLARVSSDVQNSSNSSFTNLFTIPILANEVWSFDCVIYFLTAATTTGIVMQADSPASPVASQISFRTHETATASRNLTGAQGVALVGTAGLATVLEARISGTIENGSNAGNIVIKFRSEVNASAVTVKRGSFGIFYKH